MWFHTYCVNNLLYAEMKLLFPGMGVKFSAFDYSKQDERLLNAV